MCIGWISGKTLQTLERAPMWIAQPCEPTPIKDDLLVKIFAGHIVPKQIILAELENHQKAHQKKIVYVP